MAMGGLDFNESEKCYLFEISCFEIVTNHKNAICEQTTVFGCFILQ